MPFDKISPRMLFVMRIFTGGMFLVLGSAIAILSGAGLFGGVEVVSRFQQPVDALFLFAALNFGVLLLNAGAMLLELVTKPPLKMGINVPFVAGNFQTSLVFGLVVLAFSIRHATLTGHASSAALGLQALSLFGFAMNLMFVMTTKMHWNFTANTGKPLP